jgi:DNA-binding transcriptional ArsR family regulator
VSHKAIDWAFAQPLEGSAKMVLVYLARRANDKGVCFPSHRLIGEECGMSGRTVSRALTTLREAGYVSGDRRGTNHTPEPKYYVLTGWLKSSDTPQMASLDTTQVADRSVSKKGESTSYFHAGSEAPPSKRTVGARRKAKSTGHPDDELDPANAEDLQDVPAPLPEGACPETFERTATRTGRKALCEHFGTLVLGRKFDIIESKPLSSVIRSLQEELDNDVIHGMIHAFAESPRDTDIAQWRLFAAQKSTLHQKVTRQVKAAAPETDADYAEPSAWDEEEPAWKRLAREYRETSSTEAAEVCETPATHHEEN